MKRYLLLTWFTLTVFPISGIFLAVPDIEAVEFYVDPDWAGVKSGTQGQPWSTLDSAAWTIINNTLIASDTTVYFSAREAGSDTSETYGGNLKLQRTSTSSWRLTVDGMSKWNTDDTSPHWQDYAGTCKLKLSPAASIALGWYTTQQDNITMRGFEVSGSIARVMFAGDNLVVEHIYSHDITTDGATFQMAYTTDHSCVETYGRYSNVIIRNNHIENGYGEGIYVGGTYWGSPTQDCYAYGNSHSNILIENNTIINAGVNGAQGDGIDIKRGNTNVTIRGNTIVGARNLGITAAGVFSGDQNLLIENNKIYNGFNRGIQVGSGGTASANGVIIRNNLVYNNAGMGISITGSAPGSSNVNVFNNTAYGNASVGLSYGYVNSHQSKNNLVFGNNNNGLQVSFWGTNTALDSNYNIYSPSSGYSGEGTNSLNVPDPAGLAVDAASGDFHLKPNSQAIDKGISLAGFSSDFSGMSRPQGSSWDIGAYEYISLPAPDITAPSSPKDLKIK